ncbi:MAG: 3-deoxy-D-manno-octulosonic acid transferase [Desulfomonilaceae bacterium]
MIRFLYNLVIHVVGVPLVIGYYGPKILLTGKYRRSFRGKLGFLPDTFPQKTLRKPVVWFHAVSVGEVVALAPVAREFRKLVPDSTIVVSTGTETGMSKATSEIECVDAFLYMPMDFPLAVNRVIGNIKPDLFVLMETEIWPNLLYSLKSRGTPIALANGRISDRSFPRYMKGRLLLSRLLEKIDSFMMISETDKERILQMGAPVERVRVVGNTKFDAALGNVSDEVRAEARAMLGLDEGNVVFFAGSTHPGEHETVLECFQKLLSDFPDLILIIAPRHVETVPVILEAVKERKLDIPFLRSAQKNGERRGARNIIVLDTTGELFKFYSTASVVFIGGSLVPRGGQNILEPVAWGKRIFFGPSMEDFRDARDLFVRVGVASEVRDGTELYTAIHGALNDLKLSRELGLRGRDELNKHAGSSKTTANILFHLVSRDEKA